MKKVSILFLGVLIIAAMLVSCNGSATVDVGEWDGNVYTNEQLGLTFTMPEGWESLSIAELAQQSGVGSDMFDGISEDEIEEGLNLIIMNATSPTGSMVNITIERVAGRVTAANYMEAGIEALEAELGTPISHISGDARIGGNNWRQYGYELDIGVLMGMEPGELGMYMNGRFLVNVDGGFARLISITQVDGSETIDEIIGMFSGN